MKSTLKPIVLAAAVLAAMPAQAGEGSNDWIAATLRSTCNAAGTCWEYFGPPKAVQRRGPEPQPYWKQFYWQPYYRPVLGPSWDTDRSWDRFRHYWPQRRYAVAPVYREPDRFISERERAYCVNEITRAVGVERYGREEAREAAETAWMETVRSKWGARFMDPRNSRERTFECYRSGTERASGERRREIVEQCEIVARACRSHLERD